MCVKKALLFLLFTCSLAFLWGQTKQRIEIKGIILSENQDVDGVTVFNTSSNLGTITNNNGEFVIDVSLNDRLEISGLQFNSMSVVIDEEVIKSKKVKIYLVEHVNQLDAVLLSYGLSGNIVLDIENVKMLPEIAIDLGNMDAMELKDDRSIDNQVIRDALNAIVNKGQLYNGVNFGEILKLFFKPKKRKTIKKEVSEEPKPKEILDVYTHKNISEIFNIPENSVNAFIAFVESKEINQDIFQAENKMQLIEYLIEQRKLFLEHDRKD